MSDNPAKKQRGRPFPKGVSGNPSGCQTGSRRRVSLLLDSLAEGFAEPMVKTLISRALNKGDVTAAELVLRHIWPVRKGAPVQIDIPKITSPERVLEATAKVTAAVSDGSLSPDEGVLVSQIVEASRRAIETVELERRIAALEAGAGGGPNRPDTEGNRQVEAPRPMSRPFTGGVS